MANKHTFELNKYLQQTLTADAYCATTIMKILLHYHVFLAVRFTTYDERL